MQRIKDEIRENILKAAKAEFLENGFKNASIRKIAVKAEISKSNIYNYFKNKDDLFCQILKPTMDIIYKAIESKKQEFSFRKPQTYTMDRQGAVIEVIMRFVYGNKDDFVLLLFKSEGSSYANFRDLVKTEYTNIIQSWLLETAPENKISRFFIEAVATFYITTIAELIIQNKSAEEVKNHFAEFLSFVYGGWNQLITNGGYYEKTN